MSLQRFSISLLSFHVFLWGSAISVIAHAAPTGRLNDTGQIACYDDTSLTGTVSQATPDPEVDGFKGQDCTQGHSATDVLVGLNKFGASTTPGRDYTKIANDGSVLPASATLGSGPGDWACTRDNVTGLIWEVKVNNATHLRHYYHVYTWHDTNTAINGGDPGNIGSNTCNSTLPGNLCNTTAFRDAVNALTGENRLCGATDWRLPSRTELLSLLDFGRAAAPTIDIDWFPNTADQLQPRYFWSSQSYAPLAASAWAVFFESGIITANGKGNINAVRLVRDGQ